MKRNFIIVLMLALLLPCYIKANMASPYIREAEASEVYSSRDIHILHEDLDMTILSPDTLFYQIVYTIRTEIEGKQIPLLFDTLGENYGFRVWVDGVPVESKQLPEKYDRYDMTLILDSLGINGHFSSRAFSGKTYFEAELTKGIHDIRVEYVAISSIYLGRWMRECYFTYNLAPAKDWKSFGSLELTVDARKYPNMFQFIYNDTVINVDSVLYLKFESLPADEFELRSNTEPSSILARTLITLHDYGILTLISALILESLLIWWILWYRRKYPLRKISIPVIVGSVVAPFLWLCSILFWVYAVDEAIGEYASRRHGYIFLIFFTYPVLLIIQFIIAFAIDSITKKSLRKKSQIT